MPKRVRQTDVNQFVRLPKMAEPQLAMASADVGLVYEPSRLFIEVNDIGLG